MNKILLVPIALTLSLVVFACQPNIDLERPPRIEYGADICHECGMIISEVRFASAYVTKDGAISKFDDTGCMALYHSNHSEDAAIFWVHDHDSEQWILANEANFVVNEKFTTPMGYGIVGFSDQKRATDLANEMSTVILTLDQLFDIPMRHGS